MNIFQTFGFQSPIYLIVGLFVCMGGFVYFVLQKKQENFIDYELLSQVYKTNNSMYKLFLFLCFFMSFLLFLYLSNPYISEESQKIKRNGIDIEIVFDLSYSMIANDILPNRLQAAKSVLGEFISQVENDRVGLVLFSGKPFQSIPLTYDYDFIESFIGDLEIETINQQNSQLQGTAIGDGLIVATDALGREENEREKVVILLTDGEANKGIDPELALKYIKEQGVKVYTIGVGKPGATTIELPTYGGFTQTVSVSGVDEEILQKIASETGGFYARADSTESFQKILSTIATLEKKEIETQSIELQHSLRFMVLMLMLLSLFPLIYITFRVQIGTISHT